MKATLNGLEQNEGNMYSRIGKMGIAMLVPTMVLILMVVIVKPAHAEVADFTIQPSDFTVGVATTIDFEDAPGGLIDNFYTSSGVTLENLTGGVFGDVGTGAGSTAVACNLVPDPPQFPKAALDFSPRVLRAGFYVSTQDADDTIVAIYFSDGTEKGRKTFNTGGGNGGGSFAGVEFPSGFDRLEFEATRAGAGFVCIDNLMFEEPPPNQAPVCQDINIELTEDTAKTAALSCSDPDTGDTIDIEIVAPVNLVSVTGPSLGDVGANVSLTPAPDFNGSGGTFDHQATDASGVTSNVSRATITVLAVNDAPVCQNIDIELIQDTPDTAALSCSDVDSEDTITIEIVAVDLVSVSGPSVGDEGASVSLTPGTGFSGDGGSFDYQATDDSGDSNNSSNIATATVTVDAAPTSNHAPDCTNVMPSQDVLEKPNHKMRSISLSGATDADEDSISYIIVSIFQDEAVRGKGSGNTGPDGAGVGTDTAQVRAERNGKGDGRVYVISYTASDGNGGDCNGSVSVGVPHDKRGDPAVNSGATFDSTIG